MPSKTFVYEKRKRKHWRRLIRKEMTGIGLELAGREF